MLACSGDKPAPAPVVRLDRAMAQYAMLDSADRHSMRDSLAAEFRDFFLALDRTVPGDSALIVWSQGDVVEAFQPAVDEKYPDLEDLQQQLGCIIVNAQAAGLDLPDMRFTAIAWGKPQPLMRVGNDMLIALNHYLGEDFEGYSHLQPYRRTEKTAQLLPYDLAGAIASTQYPFKMTQAPTLLNWMLYEGALVEAKMRMVPNAQLHLALGYTLAQLEYMDDNSQDMWQELSIKKMLHSTDPGIADRMLAAAPYSPLMGNKAPGRAGRYIGYILLRQYIEKHPSATLPFLLSPEYFASATM